MNRTLLLIALLLSATAGLPHQASTGMVRSGNISTVINRCFSPVPVYRTRRSVIDEIAATGKEAGNAWTWLRGSVVNAVAKIKAFFSLFG